MNNFSFNTQGATQYPMSVVPKNTTPSAPRVGVSSTQALQQSGLLPQSKPVSQGTNPGMIKSTVDSSGKTTNYDTKSNPSVLEQQKMLNTIYGAGLVEDGIIGDKTRAAISQYLSKGDSTPVVKPPEPAKIDPQSNARRVLEAGGETPREAGAFENLQQAGQATPMELEAIKRVEEAKRMSNAGRLGQYAEAGMYANKSPEELYKGLITSPDLAARGEANAGLYNTFGDIYGSAATEGLLAANTIAGRGLSAAQSGLTGAQTQASRAQEGAGTVLEKSLPTYPGYGQQVVDPLTGQPVGGGTSGSLQDAVSNVVSKLTNGQMTYDDAVNALSGYGQGGLNALQQALPSNFNVAQSNTLAGQQGSIGVNYQLADTALNNVESIMKDLGVLQSTNIPLINKGANWFSTQFGINSEATRAMTGAVQSLRNAYASLLASSKGGTPTEYSSQAVAEIPNEPTPNDLKAIRHNFEVLGKARADILGNPALSGTSTSSGGGSMWDW